MFFKRNTTFMDILTVRSRNIVILRAERSIDIDTASKKRYVSRYIQVI